MIIPCGEYIGKEGQKYLGVYNYQHDVCTGLPPGINGRRVAHFSYSKGGKKGGVDVFMLDEKHPSNYSPSLINVRKKIDARGELITLQESDSEKEDYFGKGNLKGADEKYDIQVQMVSGLSKKAQREIVNLTNSDIIYFCGEKFAKNKRGPRVEIVPEIVSRTEIGLMDYSKDLGMIRTGKREFVPTCGIEGNLDFAQGCITSISLGKNANFNGNTFENFFFSPWGECAYCYSDRKKRNFFKTIYRFDKQRLLEELKGGARTNFGSEESLGRVLRTLRFGKRTESWSEFTKESFVGALEAMLETGTRGIIPTKALSFNREIAKLLRETKSTVLYTYGWDGLETGACEQGHNNECRLENARRYRREGINSAVYLMILGHLPLGKRERKVLDLAKKEKMPVQLLPLRITSKALITRLTEEEILPSGTTWEKLKGSPGQVELEFSEDINSRKYFYDSNNLVVWDLHQDWIREIGNNAGQVRLCHHDLKETYCGGCFQERGIITKTEHVKKIRFNSSKSK